MGRARTADAFIRLSTKLRLFQPGVSMSCTNSSQAPRERMNQLVPSLAIFLRWAIVSPAYARRGCSRLPYAFHSSRLLRYMQPVQRDDRRSQELSCASAMRRWRELRALRWPGACCECRECERRYQGLLLQTVLTTYRADVVSAPVVSASRSLRTMRSFTHLALHQSIGVIAFPDSRSVKCR